MTDFVCGTCYHGDCPRRCPDDMCRGSCECECDTYGLNDDDEEPASAGAPTPQDAT